MFTYINKFLWFTQSKSGKKDLDKVPYSLLKFNLREQKHSAVQNNYLSYLAIRRRVPECLVFQYQGGLKSIREAYTALKGEIPIV